MQYSKTLYTPFVRKNDTLSKVMTDVIYALLPCVLVSYLAFGFTPLMVVLVSVGSALITEFIFTSIFLKRTDSLSDGSAIVTGILLAFTIAPFTPLYVVAFGASMAVLFGKLLWGGVGRNMFNPALVGREFMAVFFPLIMTSRAIWFDKTSVNMQNLNIFDNEFFNQLLFKASGAIGEYSIFFLILGGLFLLVRKRISWHVPFSLLVAFTLLLFIFSDRNIQFSLGGLLLGTIFMATDMPSSASTNYGKLYYGAMIGIVAMICILNGVRYEYMSYSILLVNAFSKPIDWAFRPRVWGKNLDVMTRLRQGLSITAAIGIATFAIVYLHAHGAIMYLVFLYIIFCIVWFIAKEMRNV